MSHMIDHRYVETKTLVFKYHSELIPKQYWLSCLQSHHLCHLTTQPIPSQKYEEHAEEV